MIHRLRLRLLLDWLFGLRPSRQHSAHQNRFGTRPRPRYGYDSLLSALGSTVKPLLASVTREYKPIGLASFVKNLSVRAHSRRSEAIGDMGPDKDHSQKECANAPDPIANSLPVMRRCRPGRRRADRGLGRAMRSGWSRSSRSSQPSRDAFPFGDQYQASRHGLKLRQLWSLLL
jgi:hypothetical protein